MIFSVLLANNIILVKLIDVLLTALMNTEVDIINQCSNTVNCPQFLKELSILNLPISDNNSSEIELNSHIMNAVHHKSKILDYNNNWSQLCFLEAFYIKTLKPKINAGLKASEELHLFK